MPACMEAGGPMAVSRMDSDRGGGGAGLWYGLARVQIYCMPDLGDPGRQRAAPLSTMGG